MLRAYPLILVCSAMSFAPGGVAASDYVLSLLDTGQREYYCTATIALENQTDEPLTEISGYFFTFVGDQKVGRSKGSWFMNVAPGGSATATFETPNAPCTEIDRYDFVIGACRIDAGFMDKAECASLIGGSDPINSVSALGGS